MRPQPTSATRNSSDTGDGVAVIHVLLATRLTTRCISSRKLLATLAYPTHSSCRHADHQRVWRNVLRHDCSRANETELSQRGAADDRRVGSDGRTALHESCAVFVLPRHVAARIDDVGEHHRRPAEHVIFERHTFVDGNVVLDLHVGPDARAVHHDDILPQRASFPDYRTAEYVTEVPHPGSGADLRAFIDVRRFVNENAVAHRASTGRSMRECHSCSEVTDAGRDRMASTASQAALA